MKKSQLFIILALTALLLAINLYTRDDFAGKAYFGGLPWYGWTAVSLALILTGIFFALRDARRGAHAPSARRDESAT